MELDDGSKLTQSSAIQHYCAEKAGMLPSDPWQLARTHELINVLEEVRVIFAYRCALLRCGLLCCACFGLAGRSHPGSMIWPLIPVSTQM